MKDSKGALEDFRAAIKLSPHSAHMYLNRGNLYASTQQYDLAEKDYSKGEGQVYLLFVCSAVLEIRFSVVYLCVFTTYFFRRVISIKKFASIT